MADQWAERLLEVRDGSKPAWRGRLDSVLVKQDQALGGEVATLRFDCGARELRIAARNVRAASFEPPSRITGQPRHLSVLLGDDLLTVHLAGLGPRTVAMSSEMRERVETARAADARRREQQAAHTRELVLEAIAGLWTERFVVVDSLSRQRTPKPANYHPESRGYLPRERLERARLLRVVATDVECRLTVEDEADYRRLGHEAVVRYSGVALVELADEVLAVQDTHDPERRLSVARIPEPEASDE